jgi:hypothetical protein
MKPHLRPRKVFNLESNAMKKLYRFFLAFFCTTALLWLVACLTSEDPGQVLTMEITAKNDSLLTFDSLIVTVHSEDGKFSQDVFHGVLRHPSQVENIPLDSRVGKNYTVTIVGYRGGKIGVNKEVTFTSNGAQSKDVPVHIDKPETVTVDPALPEILAPSDTSIAEGDSLRFRVSVFNPWSDATKLILKDAIPGTALDTAGRNPGEGYFTWRPSFEQGRVEVYAITFIYAAADKRVEKIMRVKVLNVNKPPRVTAIPDQKVKENETLTFNIEATDPDGDSLVLTAARLPDGATFSGGVFTWKTTLGQAGNYSVSFRAFDGADSDHVAALITVGNVDVPPPLNVKITSPTQDTVVNVISITIQYTVNGTALQKKFSLKDGRNRIRIDTTVLNRTGFDTLWVTLDTVPPGKPLVNGMSPVRTRTPTWTWSAGGGGMGVYRYKLDNEDFASSPSSIDTAFTTPDIQDAGPHTLFVQERDAAGNWSPTGRKTIRIDTTRPPPPIVKISATPTNNTMPTWTWIGSGDDASGLFRYKLDNTDFSDAATETRDTRFTPDKMGELKEGLHLLHVQQQDSAGNWSFAGNASVTVDLTPPGIPKITLAQASPTNNRQPTWNLASGVEGVGFYRLKMDDSTWSFGAKSGKVISFKPDSALAEGVHTLFVQERDSAGNWSPTVWKTVILDLTGPSAPKIDSTPYSPLNSLRPTWTWRSGGDGMKRYRCKVDTSNLDGALERSDSSFTPNENLAQGEHILYVQERDSVGNWSAASARQIFVSLREFVGSPGFAKGSPVKIAVNSKGIPYLGYFDNGSIKVKKFEEGAWKDVGTPISAPSYRFQLKLSPKDVPYIAYQNKSGLDDIVSVMKLVGNTWSELEGGKHRVIDSERGFEIDVDGQENLFLAFQDSVNGLQVLKYTGYWASVGDSGLKNLALTHIGVTGSGIPYILATDYDVWQSNVWTLSANKWVPLPSIGRMVSPWLPYFQVTQNGNVFVSFYADDIAKGGSYSAKIVSYQNGNWETVFPGENITQLPIAINASGTLYRLQRSVYKYTGTSWLPVGGTVDAYESALAVAPNGVVYLGNVDDASGFGSISVLKISFEP